MKLRVMGSLVGIIVAATFPIQSGATDTSSSGYVTDARGFPVKSSAGICWKTGYWTPAMATLECDSDLVRTPLPASSTNEQWNARSASSVIGIPKQTPENIAMSADGMFPFGKFTLLPKSKAKLDLIATKLRMRKYSKVVITGHSDRLGTTSGNVRLSKARADSVKAFFVSKGIEASRIETVGMGASQPLTKRDQCEGKKAYATP